MKGFLVLLVRLRKPIIALTFSFKWIFPRVLLTKDEGFSSFMYSSLNSSRTDILLTFNIHSDKYFACYIYVQHFSHKLRMLARLFITCLAMYVYAEYN